MTKLAVAVLLLCAVTFAQTQTTADQKTTDSQKRKSVATSLSASAEHKGAWDFGVWGFGGHRVAGGFRSGQITDPLTGATVLFRNDRVGDVSVVNAGFRVGKILTDSHGGSWFRGNLEYAADVIPVYVLTGVTSRTIFTPPSPCPLVGVPCVPANLTVGPGTVYGAGFNPVVLKWNFTGAKRFSPYFELNGGVLFTNHEVPVFTSDVNFMSGATLGLNIFVREKRSLSLDFRYAHISNAGLSSLNPGLNTLQGGIGYHWWK